MAEKVKRKDFVEIDYTGKEKESGITFDTTKEDVAKANNIHSKQAVYKPIIVCMGEKQVLRGLDRYIEGKETGNTYSFEIPPEDGFGKKNAKLLKIIPLRVFNKEKVQAAPGLQVNIDGVMGVIKTVGSGRVVVDFNHPLSGKTLVYDIDIKRVITDKKEKISGYLKTTLAIKDEDVQIELKDDEAKLIFKKKLPQPLHEGLSKKLTDLVGLKKLTFD